MKIIAIFAVADNGVIGRHNDMPWHLPADFKLFKSITSGSPIIMGRKTYESIGRPLPKRTNIIITRNKDYAASGCLIAHDMQEALAIAKKEYAEKCFIIGGANILRQHWDMIEKVCITRVHASPLGDVFFDFDSDGWTLLTEKYHPADSKNLIPFTFQEWVRS